MDKDNIKPVYDWNWLFSLVCFALAFAGVCALCFNLGTTYNKTNVANTQQEHILKDRWNAENISASRECGGAESASTVELLCNSTYITFPEKDCILNDSYVYCEVT